MATHRNGSVPTPDVEDRAPGWVERWLTPTRALWILGGAIIALFVAGWAASKATADKSDVDKVEKRVETQDVRLRGVEVGQAFDRADIAWLKNAVYQTARATGATVLPPPVNPAPVTATPPKGATP